MGGAIAGRPIAVRYVDNRKRQAQNEAEGKSEEPHP
jgi:hypothetical protein